jgi:pimeloyl-ACP methyl ester carboxylesterase
MRLDGARQVVGLQARRLFDSTARADSLIGLAEDYAAVIRKAQPSGPYHLLGWSLGGALAVLVAATLEREGADVVFLGLVDSFVPQASPAVSLAAPADWREDLRSFLALALPQALIPDIGAGDAPIEDVVRSVVAATLAGGSLASGFSGLDADGLTAVFFTARDLRDIAAASSSLMPVRAPVRTWWTSGGVTRFPALNEQLGDCENRGIVGDDHFAISRDPRLIEDIAGLLARVSPRLGNRNVEVAE